MKRPDTSLVFLGAFLTPWCSAATIGAHTWFWRINDVIGALVGAWLLKRFADQVLAARKEQG